MIKFCLWIIFHENTSKVYKAISCISIMKSQCDKWSQIGQWSSCSTIGTNGLLSLSLRGIVQTVPQAANLCWLPGLPNVTPICTGAVEQEAHVPVHFLMGTCLKSHSPRLQQCSMGFVHVALSLTLPSDCLLLFTTPLLFLSLVVSCCSYFLSPLFTFHFFTDY